MIHCAQRWVRMAIRGWWLGLAMVMLASCGGPETANPDTRPSISPEDFALVPCGPARADRPCVLAVAGGKRILFGAPAGVSATLADADLRQLDAVMLFSLHAVDIEGLDEVRNASWHAGRSEPLLVVGPEGTLGVVEALNAAFEQADALRVVEEGMPPGGYDAAVLVGREVVRGASAPVFDTGDVRVFSSPMQMAIEYVGKTAETRAAIVIYSCMLLRSEQNGVPVVSSPVRTLGCGTDDLSWPLNETVFIVKSE